jgi:serine protease Do
MAVGNPFGQGHSATHGIISAKGRLNPEFPIGNYLQTDAPINPGNSGGPLVNLEGEVIGINTAIEARAQGIGFAIPINLVRAVLPQLRTKGVVVRGYIGVLVGPLTPEVAEKLGASKDLQAPFVTEVYPESPAQKAGIKTYDIVLEFNNKAVHSPSELIAAVTNVPIGDTVPMKVIRNGKEESLKITISKRPGEREMNPKKRSSKPKEEKEPPNIHTGLKLENLTPDLAHQLGITGNAQGVVVADVEPGSAADEAGLSRGDIIVEVDKKSVPDVKSFYYVVNAKKSYLLRVRRPSPAGSEGQEVYSIVVLDIRNKGAKPSRSSEE